MSAAAELRGFILRQEVLHLYRAMMRLSKAASNQASRGGETLSAQGRLHRPLLGVL